MNAKTWLLAHGYTQFQDGSWSQGGYEADLENALQEYMDEVEQDMQKLCGWLYETHTARVDQVPR